MRGDANTKLVLVVNLVDECHTVEYLIFVGSWLHGLLSENYRRTKTPPIMGSQGVALSDGAKVHTGVCPRLSKPAGPTGSGAPDWPIAGPLKM